MVHPRLQHIRIILLEPAGALNVGSAARVMANMGLSQLVLVNPHCDPLGEEAQRMAVHAGDILTQAQIVPTLAAALTDCTKAIATTARDRALNTTMELPEVALPWLVAPASDLTPAPAALIFGPEDRGLSNEELNYAQRFVRIPSDASYTSLNLAQAIAVCCYELARAATPRVAIAAPPPPPSEVKTAPLDQLEGFHQHLEAVLLKIGYLYPHTATSRMEKLRRFFVRAAPTSQELAMLRGILRQTDWASSPVHRSPTSPPDRSSPNPPQG
ncbi:RNA methyltransferase [Leptolyngbya iicbica]|uniref:tRNA (cytidine/uridine-2'-O-)-methyltransferase TrmJ n=2 Tax=Cyanophyceae TaxID=3028117 RepID=A0A4Q7EE04_9CYAN|nr:RNA methyltransferase [Leptolyngbya sp. LK]RZM79465.1 RNA methyltransferase [Leptolyngbya sp. LK]